ncbi:MauE/DoxX family redox-associated membrane protein [Paenibacillus aurantiacus]|uniref:MauE/DoxX family redox-associated membrane protein n=1 Tax=Paenibacillus aurantiacus TaxID=1936118 RepID=A0ABV5KGP9_9BACL
MAVWLGTVIAFVFFSSSLSKLMNVLDFRMELSVYRIPYRWTFVLAWLVLLFEMVLAGLFLWEDGFTGWKHGAGIAFIVVLTGATVMKNGLKSNTCSCFGANHPLSRFPVQRNAVIVALMFIHLLLPHASASGSSLTLSILVIVNAAFLLENIKSTQLVGVGGQEG